MNEIDLSIEDVLRVAIEADDESSLDLKPVILQSLYGLDQIAIGILVLAALPEAVLIGGLNSDKYAVETGICHQPHEVLVIGNPNGNLCKERKWIVPFLHPGYDGRKYLSLQLLFVADEVVVHYEDGIAPAEAVDGVHFGD